MFRVAVTAERSRAYSRMILAGVVRYSKLHGPWQLHGQPLHFVRPMPDFSTWDGDGVIVMAASQDRIELLKNIRACVVNVSARFEHIGLPTVIPDNYAVGRLAAQHLIDRGFRHFAYYGPADHGYSIDRRRGVMAELSSRRLECETPDLPTNGLDWESQITLTQNWLRRLPLPAAVIASNDDMAMLLLLAIQEAGLRCPEDLAVIGADNDSLAGELSVPSLSSVDLNAFQVGFEAAALLQRLMNGEPPPRSPVLIPPAGVVPRQSTDVLATQDPMLRDALAFIRQSYRGGLSVEQVLDHVGCSRRSLELRFKGHLNRSPADEIRRVQVDAAKQLLIDSDLSLEEIADRVGVRTLRQLAILFRRCVGCAPSDFRRQQQQARVREIG